jgi:hypothetical protein
MVSTVAANEVDSVEELNEGDTVRISGNGMVHTADIAVIKRDSWKGKKVARMEPANGLTVTLTDSEHHLKTSKITTNVAATTVERIA